MSRGFSVSSASKKRKVFAKTSLSLDALSSLCRVHRSTLYLYLDTLPRDSEAFSKIPVQVVEAFLLLKCRNIYFYTSPPNHAVPWLWILTNVFTADFLADLLDVYRSMGIKTYAVKAILDAGVDRWWRKPCEKLSADYTEEYWNSFWSAVDKVKSFSKEFGFSFEITVPDYPDDYSSAWGRKHCLWIDNYTNVDRTLENVFYIIEQDKNVSWLLPAQGYEDVPQSVLKAIEVYVNHNLHKRYRIGLANLCTSKKASIIVETIRLAREFCGECVYHIFGPSLTAIKNAVKHGILQPGDSWDSAAWTFPRGNGWSAKTSEERVAYFLFYLRHIAEALMR